MKPLICCSFLVFLFWACHEWPSAAPAVLPAGISDPLSKKAMGTYTGQFGKGLITVVVNYINGPAVSGYDIHKGLRRNFNGEVSQQGGLLQRILKEPGSNPFDGRFTLYRAGMAPLEMGGNGMKFVMSESEED